MQPGCFADFRRGAARRLPPFLFEYIDSGAFHEVTFARNHADLDAVELRQRVMRDMSSIDTSARLLGEDCVMPVALSPVGMAGMFSRRGEVQAARAAGTVGVPFSLSSAACCSLEEVAEGAPDARRWYQLYMLRDRGYMKALLERAMGAGYSALLVTVDTAMLGARYRDFRAGISNDPWPIRTARLAAQILPRPHWSWNVGLHGRPHGLGNMTAAVRPGAPLAEVMAWMQGNLEAGMTWADLDWLRHHWQGPIVVKGLLDADDAIDAATAGVDAIVVSNHGGRQLDGVPSTARALPAIADRLSGRLPLFFDGGVRSGLDVARMLALGAQGVMLGRAWAFALAAGGEAGVRRMLNLLHQELRVAMALTGATKIEQLDRHALVDLEGNRT